MKVRTIVICLAGFICLLMTTGTSAQTVCSEPVETSIGTVRGAEENGSCVFKGMPYAAPPVGELRWRPPQEPAEHGGVYQALSVSASCLNPGNRGGFITGKKEESSEDCLYLNIWRPSKSGKYPVMFWIHGGGFMNGSGSMKFYHGIRLVEEKNVVLVTINYRLGPMGFLACPEFAEEDPNGSTGNYGIMD